MDQVLFGTYRKKEEISVITFKKHSDEQVSKDFKAYEFDCPCDHCTATPIEMKLIEMLQVLRDEIGFPVKITSGYRCAAYQEDLKRRGYETAKGISQHELGAAVDIKTGHHTGEELEKFARQVGFMAVGVGKHWVHIDLRPEHHRWTYTY